VTFSSHINLGRSSGPQTTMAPCPSRPLSAEGVVGTALQLLAEVFGNLPGCLVDP
jgi:hypothetical protein